jgi:hypothetical protein
LRQDSVELQHQLEQQGVFEVQHWVKLAPARRHYTLDWLGFQVPWFERFMRAPPLLLIKDGKMLRHNTRQELIMEEELMSQIRQQGPILRGCEAGLH